MAEDQIVNNLWLRLNTLAFGRPLKKIDRQAKANFLCCYLFINLISVTLAKNILHYLPIQNKNESFSLPILKCGQTKNEKKSIFWHFVVQSLQLLFKLEVSYFFQLEFLHNYGRNLQSAALFQQKFLKSSAVILSADK